MEWLEAALAFAVVMMVFSTMVSVIVETMHRIFRLREDGLRRIIKTVYSTVIQPRLASQLRSQGGTMDEFIDRMTATRFLPADKSACRVMKVVPAILNAQRLKSLSTLEFVERLAETPVGRVLVGEGQRRGARYADSLLEDLASKYEDIGESAREYFARRALATSVVVAVVLAFALNISAMHLFRTLLTDKSVREAWTDRGNAVAEQLHQRQGELDQLLAQRTEEGEAHETPAQRIEKVEKNINEIHETVESLRDLGTPIGWATTPWRTPQWDSADSLENKTWLVVKWLVGVLFAGLLIGLGGPFWFDTFKKLSSLTAVVRGLQTPVQRSKESGQAPEEAAGTQVAAVFETAAKGQGLGTVSGRPLLTPDGLIDREVER